MNINILQGKSTLLKILLFLAISVLGSAYIYFTWSNVKKNQSENVLKIGRSVGAMFLIEDLQTLEATSEDIDKPQYIHIKNKLRAIKIANPEARFAYLYTEKNGKIFFIADSEPEKSEDYSPPGQEFSEAESQDIQPFKDGKALVTSPLTDRWGTWVSVLTPIKDKSTGKIVAVFGLDFDAKSWNTLLFGAILQSSLLVILLILSALFLLRIRVKNLSLMAEISGREKIEAALLKAKEDSEMANKAKSIFLSNMSHEIRTPLNAIIGFSQLMNRDKQLSEIQKEYNVSIIRAGEHLLELINEILELSKIEVGRAKLNPITINLLSFCNDIETLFKGKAHSKHLRFIVEVSEDLPQYIEVDEGKLRQIFVNLIGNAIKFTDEGGVAVRIRVDTKEGNSNNLVVEIQDSGLGISESERGKLFKHFEQTSSGAKKGSGTGLGLALSRELAVLMGGNITVDSEVDKGSVFTFWVEIKDGKNNAKDKINPKHVVSIYKEDKEQYRILVVDDKNDNLRVVVSLLRFVGFHTNEAINGEDAIVKFIEYKPHLILMDMRMPVMDGYEATRRIKAMENGGKTPIIALTASTFEEEKKKIESLNMQGYIRKPFRESELFGTIGKVLGLKYIYEEEDASVKAEEILDTDTVIKYINNLPDNIVSDMSNAISVADFDLLMDIISLIETDNPELCRYLKNLALNYDYDHFHHILNNREKH